MLFKILDSQKLVDIKVQNYLINWNKKVTRGGKKNFGKFQFDFKKLIRPFWEEDIVCEEFPIPAKTGEKGKSVDFINLTEGIIVETSGRQHTQKSWSHKTSECFRKQLYRDDFKMRWAGLNKFKFIEIYEDDILNIDLLKRLEILLDK